MGRADVGSKPCALEVAGSRVFVTVWDDGTVVELDPRTAEPMASFEVGEHPCGIAWVDGALWVALLSDRELVRVDPDTPASGGDGWGTPNCSIWDLQPGQGSVWVVDRGMPGVRRLDPTTGEELASARVGGTPSGIVATDDGVWVAQQASGTIVFVDAASGAVSEPVEVGAGATWFADGPQALWVTSQAAGTTARIDPATGEVLATVTTGDQPLDAAHAGGAVWVPDRTGGQLLVVDDTRDEVVATLDLGARASSWRSPWATRCGYWTSTGPRSSASTPHGSWGDASRRGGRARVRESRPVAGNRRRPGGTAPDDGIRGPGHVPRAACAASGGAGRACSRRRRPPAGAAMARLAI